MNVCVLFLRWASMNVFPTPIRHFRLNWQYIFVMFPFTRTTIIACIHILDQNASERGSHNTHSIYIFREQRKTDNLYLFMQMKDSLYSTILANVLGPHFSFHYELSIRSSTVLISMPSHLREREKNSVGNASMSNRANIFICSLSDVGDALCVFFSSCYGKFMTDDATNWKYWVICIKRQLLTFHT